MTTINWSDILSQSFDELDEPTVQQLRKQIFSIDTDKFGDEDLRQLFELSRFILKDTLVGHKIMNFAFGFILIAIPK